MFFLVIFSSLLLNSLSELPRKKKSHHHCGINELFFVIMSLNWSDRQSWKGLAFNFFHTVIAAIFESSIRSFVLFAMFSYRSHYVNTVINRFRPFLSWIRLIRNVIAFKISFHTYG